jgi:hypothetical protein
METKKQTAVEWLVEQLKERGYAGEFPPHLLFHQAKAMEKEQIIEAYEIGESEWTDITYENGNDYYNKTYEQ